MVDPSPPPVRPAVSRPGGQPGVDRPARATPSGRSRRRSTPTAMFARSSTASPARRGVPRSTRVRPSPSPADDCGSGRSRPGDGAADSPVAARSCLATRSLVRESGVESGRRFERRPAWRPRPGIHSRAVRCPQCSSMDDKVVDSRSAEEGGRHPPAAGVPGLWTPLHHLRTPGGGSVRGGQAVGAPGAVRPGQDRGRRGGGSQEPSGQRRRTWRGWPRTSRRSCA